MLRYHRCSISILHDAVASIVLTVGLSIPAVAQTTAPITQANWGAVSAPVFGRLEIDARYAGAELFPGPGKQPDGYYRGVLPNGRVVTPAGTCVQVGTNPLGATLTPDGKYLLVSNDDERENGAQSLRNPLNFGGYSLTVLRVADMRVLSRFPEADETAPAARLFIGLEVTGRGPYTIWASAGPDNEVLLLHLSAAGRFTGSVAHIPVKPLTSAVAGYVSNYSVKGKWRKPAPTGFSATGSQTTFPAGLALSADGRYVYVACNGDNSLAIIDTRSRRVIRQAPVGFFPYGVCAPPDGSRVYVTNWGVTEYKFKNPTYDAKRNLTEMRAVEGNQPDGFYVPVQSSPGTDARNRSSSISVIDLPGGDPRRAVLKTNLYSGRDMDALVNVGGTHPCACAIVGVPGRRALYVAKANSDSLAVLPLDGQPAVPDFDLALLNITIGGRAVHGAYPNALAVSPDRQRLCVAEAGINSVAVLDVSDSTRPLLLGRIPTGWYPTALAFSPDGSQLYVVNAKGIGEDVNPYAFANPRATGLISWPELNKDKERDFTWGADSNTVFGTVQKIDFTRFEPGSRAVTENNYSVQSARLTDVVRPGGAAALDNNHSVQPARPTDVVPLGGAASSKITHVFMILQENKTFDSMLGNMKEFGNYASTRFNLYNGEPYNEPQYTQVCPNTQALARRFAEAVNYYSDSEESDAGHQYCASGTATDYTEKTLLVKSGRGLLVNKNFDPEDYPESGYIFNNAARSGVPFKVYGDMVRIAGTDTGTSRPTKLNDPTSGKLGYPMRNADGSLLPLSNGGDVTSPTQGLGQSYFMAMPALAVLGTNNPDGEARLDRNYPGYNFNISDQRRALEFCRDFDRMAAQGTLPRLFHIYLPNDHTGSVQAPNAAAVGSSPAQQVADGDIALGMVVQHIMRSPVYYDAATETGSAIFCTYDDAQATKDHIHPHRTPMMLISPFARPGMAKRHYSSASIVKTEELLLGMPPNNLGDLFATDLRDMFQHEPNGITWNDIPFARTVAYAPSPEGTKIWSLAGKLDTASPDQDSPRLGMLARFSMRADRLHDAAKAKGHLAAPEYRQLQNRLLRDAKFSLAQDPR